MSTFVNTIKRLNRTKFVILGYICYTDHASLLQSGNREEVVLLGAYLTSFFVSVAASVAAYYVCKWLDGHGKGK